jgi:hypothetical protein
MKNEKKAYGNFGTALKEQIFELVEFKRDLKMSKKLTLKKLPSLL